MAPGEDFLPAVCKLKHNTIDKDINDIKEDVSEIKKEEQSQYEEIKDMIENLTSEAKLNHQNLKNKIILVNKSMGDKIDDLNDFDKVLRGNGDPGIWESIRSIEKDVKLTKKIGYWFVGVFAALVIILIIITLGGSWHGVTKKTIKEEGPFRPKTKQVAPAPKINREYPKFTIPK